MYILATGMNPADANSLKRAPRVAIFQAFVEAMKFLQDRGEQLTWRRMLVGDPIPSDVDAVIVSSMLPRSLNCPFALGVIWTISEALRLGIPLVIYLTDWRFFAAHNEFKSIAKAGQSYFSKQIGGSLQYEEPPAAVERHGEALLDICRQYGDPYSTLWMQSQILVPKYTNWGDMSIVQRMLPGANPVFTLDPTPIFLWYLDQNPNPKIASDLGNRTKHWILPSLLKDDTWVERQNLQWPVDRFGPKGFQVLPTEWDIHREYQNAVGALCPPYPTVGSGWWRSRWIHSARAGSVLLCDSRDARQVSSAYAFSGSSYESMDFGGLRRTAAAQQEAMYSLLQTDEDRFADQLYAPFRAASVV